MFSYQNVYISYNIFDDIIQITTQEKNVYKVNTFKSTIKRTNITLGFKFNEIRQDKHYQQSA